MGAVKAGSQVVDFANVRNYGEPQLELEVEKGRLRSF